MSGTYEITVGDKGRMVIPAELRTARGIHTGSRLILIDTPEGMLLASRDQALARIRAMLKGPSLVDELIADRRAEAAREDAESA